MATLLEFESKTFLCFLSTCDFFLCATHSICVLLHTNSPVSIFLEEEKKNFSAYCNHLIIRNAHGRIVYAVALVDRHQCNGEKVHLVFITESLDSKHFSDWYAPYHSLDNYLQHCRDLGSINQMDFRGISFISLGTLKMYILINFLSIFPYNPPPPA